MAKEVAGSSPAVAPRLDLDQPQDDVAIALARPRMAVRFLAHTARSWANLEGQLRVDFVEKPPSRAAAGGDGGEFQRRNVGSLRLR
jgi:hypothetical protein